MKNRFKIIDNIDINNSFSFNINRKYIQYFYNPLMQWIDIYSNVDTIKNIKGLHREELDEIKRVFLMFYKSTEIEKNAVKDDASDVLDGRKNIDMEKIKKSDYYG